MVFIGHPNRSLRWTWFPEGNRGGSEPLQEIQVLLESASKTMDFLLKFERGVKVRDVRVGVGVNDDADVFFVRLIMDELDDLVDAFREGE